MLLSILHGLGVRRNPMQATETYNRLIADAHSAPLGKSYGSYTLDTLSEQAIIKTINLPNLAGYLKQTQLDFLLERFNTVNGDFIIASVQPLFPVNLGTPIINEHYINALRGRKFITYQNGVNWTTWKEIGGVTSYLADFRAIAGSVLELNIDPVSVREYFVYIESNASINVNIGSIDKFTSPIFIDFVPDSFINNINWPTGVITWTSDNSLAPALIEVGFRLRVELKRSDDGLLIGSYFLYKVF